jgi:hypothetical protein
MSITCRGPSPPTGVNLHLPPSFQRSVGYTLSSYGSMFFGNRPVRTRMRVGLGAGEEIPPATRLCFCIINHQLMSSHIDHVKSVCHEYKIQIKTQILLIPKLYLKWILIR